MQFASGGAPHQTRFLSLLALPTTVRFGVFGSKYAKSNQSQETSLARNGLAGWQPIKAFKESIFK